uniref:Uncharacterized protein n=1 Tax=Oryza glumipatula TaxID=40148 RepID=A0A0D9Y8U5_9ORYZ
MVTSTPAASTAPLISESEDRDKKPRARRTRAALPVRGREVQHIPGRQRSRRTTGRQPSAETALGGPTSFTNNVRRTTTPSFGRSSAARDRALTSTDEEESKLHLHVHEIDGRWSLYVMLHAELPRLLWLPVMPITG